MPCGSRISVSQTQHIMTCAQDKEYPVSPEGLLALILTDLHVCNTEHVVLYQTKEKRGLQIFQYMHIFPLINTILI